MDLHTYSSSESTKYIFIELVQVGTEVVEGSKIIDGGTSVSRSIPESEINNILIVGKIASLISYIFY